MAKMNKPLFKRPVDPADAYIAKLEAALDRAQALVACWRLAHDLEMDYYYVGYFERLANELEEALELK